MLKTKDIDRSAEDIQGKDVYKERGKLKREGMLVTHQSFSTSNGQSEITVVKDQPRLMEYVDHDGSGTTHRFFFVNDYDIPPLDKKNLMSMNTRVPESEGACLCNSQTWHTSRNITERVRTLFVMSSRDPYGLQNTLTVNIYNAPPKIQSIINKSSQHVSTDK